MRAMKDSGIEWIGQIPQEWHVDRLKYCANLDREKLSEKTEPEYAFHYIDISSVTEYGGIGNTQEMMFEKSPSRARMVVQDGDTIISTVRTYLKAIAYIDGLEDHICSTGFCVVTPNEKLHPKFGYYLLQSDYFVQKIVSESVGVSYPAISSTEIGNMAIAIPSPENQARIAHYLDSKCAEIDALITAKEKTNALLKEQRQSIIYEAVTKGLNPDAPMKESGIEWIGQIPAHWECISLKYCIQHVGSGTSVNAEDRPANTDEMGVLKTSCVSSGTFVAVANKTILEGEHDRASCPVKADTVIVSRMNTPDLVGACGYVEEDYPNLYLPDRLWQVEFTEDCIAKYMWYFLTSKYVRNYYASVCTGTSGSMQNISQDQFGAIAFFKPTKAEQQQIVEQLDKECNALMLLIEINEISLRKLKEYRQSIIYEAVTGKIEI